MDGRSDVPTEGSKQCASHVAPPCGGLAGSSEALAKSNPQAYKGIVVQKAAEARMTPPGLEQNTA